MIKKIFFVAFLFLLFFSCFTVSVDASIIKVTKNGKIIWGVLSYETDSQIKIKNIASVSDKNEANEIYLKNEGDKLTLEVNSDSSVKKADITNFEGNILEIETHKNPQNIIIYEKDGRFVINQQNYLATTSLSIILNPQDQTLSVGTSRGTSKIIVLPQEAVSGLIRANIITNANNSIFLDENETGRLVYKINGEKIIEIFNLLEINVPVFAEVSPTDGKLVDKIEPKWFSVLGFLFS